MRLGRSTLGMAVLLLAAWTAPGRVEDPSPATDIGFGHVHDLGLNPGDGAVYAATHTGVFRLDPGRPERIADRRQDTMGFTVAGADTFLGSGVGADNSVTSCDLHVLVDEAAESVSSQWSNGRCGGRGSAACGRV